MSKRNYAGEVAVVIPVYKEKLTSAEMFSLNKTLKVLAGRDIFIIAPEFLKDILTKTYLNTNLKFKFFQDKYFTGVDGYNWLLMSALFYKAFANYNFMLIVQLDALVFNDKLSDWCERNYSYVGSPLFVGLHSPVKPLRFLQGGNGGFSLRKIDDFIKVFSTPRHMPNFYTTNLIAIRPVTYWERLKTFAHNFIFSYNFQPLLPRINEDAFWSILVPKYCDFFKVASPEDEVAFGFEVEPRHLYQLNNYQVPFGCHAWEKYDKQFWVDISKHHSLDINAHL